MDISNLGGANHMANIPTIMTARRYAIAWNKWGLTTYKYPPPNM